MDKQKINQIEWYDSRIQQKENELTRISIEEHVRRLKLLLPVQKSCLSLNCGCGRGYQNGLFGPSIGLDISFQNIKALKKTGGLGIVADMEFLPFKEESFDIVYGFGILHHLNNIKIGISEAVRVLKDGGYIGFGGENNGLCPLNYIMPFLYRNWKIERGFYRIRKNNIRRIFQEAGIREIKIFHEGMTVYGMGRIVYKITKSLEKIFSPMVILRRFYGYFYISGRKENLH